MDDVEPHWFENASKIYRPGGTRLDQCISIVQYEKFAGQLDKEDVPRQLYQYAMESHQTTPEELHADAQKKDRSIVSLIIGMMTQVGNVQYKDPKYFDYGQREAVEEQWLTCNDIYPAYITIRPLCCIV